MNYNKEMRKSINRLNENLKNNFGPNLYKDGAFCIKAKGSLDTDKVKLLKSLIQCLKLLHIMIYIQNMH